MSSYLGLVIGGFLPAIFFGLSGFFAKSSTNAGVSLGPYMVLLGTAIAGVGTIALTIFPERHLTLKATMFSLLSGGSWALGAGCVAYALLRYGMPVSKLVPLYNMNTLVTALLGLWIYAEWKQVHMPLLLAGAICIVIGGVLVSRA